MSMYIGGDTKERVHSYSLVFLKYTSYHTSNMPTPCVSGTRFNSISHEIEEVLHDPELHKQIMDILARQLNFTPEAYQRHLESYRVSNKARNDAIREKFGTVYTDARREYYQKNKERLNAQRAEAHRARRCENNAVAMCGRLQNPRYDGYCSHCFRNLFPADPRVKDMRTKSKEIRWVNGLLDSPELSGYDWRWDKPMYVDFFGGCCATKRRIDLWTLVGSTIVAVEIDENQHKDRAPDYEETRYNDLFMDFSGRYVFLRINPDKYKVAGVKSDPDFDTRLEMAIEKLGSILASFDGGNTDLVTVHHMFYDEE
jgi:hypothetical protein